MGNLPMVLVFRALKAADTEDACWVVTTVAATVGRLSHLEELTALSRRVVSRRELLQDILTGECVIPRRIIAKQSIELDHSIHTLSQGPLVVI